MFLKSVRFRFLAAYLVLLTLTLLSFSFFTYEAFSKLIYDDFDDLLSSRAEGIANSVNAYWQARGIGSTGNAGPSNMKVTDSDAHFILTAQKWMEEERKDPDLMKIFVRVLDKEGRILLATKSIPRVGRLDRDDLEDILSGKESFDNIDGMSADERKKMNFRLYSRPVMFEGKTSFVIQVAGPITLVSVALTNLKLTLFILLPLAVILAGIPGIFLARLMLKPVDRMIDTLKRITMENLRLKIHIPDTKDEIKRLAETFNDMIERIERSVSSQQRFLHDISHEFRAPLNILRGEISAVLDKGRLQGEYAGALKRSLREIEELNVSIESLLSLSRSDAKLFIEIRDIDLSAVLKESLENIKVLADGKGIELALYSAQVVTMEGDAIQLKRLMLNILDNAIKYTRKGGRVTLTLSKESENAKITVSDTGIGMPKEELPYIFDRFYQIVRSHKYNDGFGIGLSVAKSIVDAHRGSISADSERGRGSTFTVLLPLSYPA